MELLDVSSIQAGKTELDSSRSSSRFEEKKKVETNSNHSRGTTKIQVINNSKESLNNLKPNHPNTNQN